MNGVIVINKEKAYTSHDVVARARGILKTKKIGHTGTLDPDATGVLPLCIGKATKIAEFFVDDDKTYFCKMKFGEKTDTADASGKVIARSEKSVDEDAFERVCEGFIGESFQLPPMYSSVKIRGKKLYEYARAGIEIEREARRIFIHSLADFVFDGDFVSFRVSCSKGSYIRTLCEDLAEKMGSFAHMVDLCREKSGQFELQNSISLAELERLVLADEISQHILPIEKLLDAFETVTASEDAGKYVENGSKLFAWAVNEDIQGKELGKKLLVKNGQSLAGLYELAFDSGLGENFLKPSKMLFL